MAVAHTPPVNSVSNTARRPAAGFTLIEVLIVLFILGLVTTIAVVQVNSYWQRARLQTAAGDLRTFLQNAYSEAVAQHTAMTVSLQQTTPACVFQVAPPPLKGPSTLTLPDVIDCATLSPDATSGGWPVVASLPTVVCSQTGLTFVPAGATCASTETPGAQVREVKTLAITHKRMIDGSLSPYTRFDVQLFPIWNVSYRKVLL